MRSPCFHLLDSRLPWCLSPVDPQRWCRICYPRCPRHTYRYQLGQETSCVTEIYLHGSLVTVLCARERRSFEPSPAKDMIDDVESGHRSADIVAEPSNYSPLCLWYALDRITASATPSHERAAIGTGDKSEREHSRGGMKTEKERRTARG